MALDEPKENDDVYDVKGHKLVVDKEFMKQAQTIKVDFSGMGFKIDSKIDFGDSGCSSCGTEGSCCS
jgi:iron-sulfur cluster assembly protein